MLNKKSRSSSQPLLKLISLVIFIVCLITGIYFFNANNKEVVVCTNPYEVKDSTSGHDAIKICDNAFYRGDVKIVDDKEFPDLFGFSLGKDKKPDKVKQFVRVFRKEKTDYISIVSVIDYTSWINSAIGIYRKDDDKYSTIFKKSFDDNQGRWVNIEFGEDYTTRDPYFYLSSRGEGFSISGDLGYLGCYGACRMLWWDYYDWDSSKEMFVLSNNKHAENFKKLLENYEDLDKTKCLDEANVSESISTLYPLRKNKDKICSDNSVVPYTTPEQAAMLLKGIKAIKMIIAGENIPMSMIGDIKLD